MPRRRPVVLVVEGLVEVYGEVVALGGYGFCSILYGALGSLASSTEDAHAAGGPPPTILLMAAYSPPSSSSTTPRARLYHGAVLRIGPKRRLEDAWRATS